jgi:hypothetical protein
MPAYLSPEEKPPALPEDVQSIAFLFSKSPYIALGILKGYLSPEELSNCYFTEGLASIIFVGLERERGSYLRTLLGNCPFEHWTLDRGIFTCNEIHHECPPVTDSDPAVLQLPTCQNIEFAVYIEQINASLIALWAAYRVYLPTELSTLVQLAEIATKMVNQGNNLIDAAHDSGSTVHICKQINAITSGLVELSAALSYAVTQGTTGSIPILSSKSPFPHHSLLGIGTAVRAITNFTRYMENVFCSRSAGRVIDSQYSQLKCILPSSIPGYSSGEQYKFERKREETGECFDTGGEFPQEDTCPLIAHFSLRHGFMESKFSVTAASEALSAETRPQWTLMTLSHELMHSRVRSIFQALFGAKWEEQEHQAIKKAHYGEFADWVQNRAQQQQLPISTCIRIAILNFCYAIEQYANPILREDNTTGKLVSHDKLNECYVRHKQLAIELIVHFHDYYFSYACQPKMYLMSLWGSWIQVAAPTARPMEYLVRSLATVACGTGLSPRVAYDGAVEMLTEAVDSLKNCGLESPLYEEIMRLAIAEQEGTRALFKPFYFLIDQVRLFFASPKIAGKIDRIETDPFAEGSSFASDYLSNIYVFGDNDGKRISPIRFSLAALQRAMTGRLPIKDDQWLTAWNFMVISSLEEIQ